MTRLRLKWGEFECIVGKLGFHSYLWWKKPHLEYCFDIDKLIFVSIELRYPRSFHLNLFNRYLVKWHSASGLEFGGGRVHE